MTASGVGVPGQNQFLASNCNCLPIGTQGADCSGRVISERRLARVCRNASSDWDTAEWASAAGIELFLCCVAFRYSCPQASRLLHSTRQ